MYAMSLQTTIPWCSAPREGKKKEFTLAPAGARVRLIIRVNSRR